MLHDVRHDCLLVSVTVKVKFLVSIGFQDHAAEFLHLRQSFHRFANLRVPKIIFSQWILELIWSEKGGKNGEEKKGRGPERRPREGKRLQLS
jgi:hypothetical protein